MEITLLWAWRHSEPEAARTWINQRLDEAWNLLDLLAVLLPPDQAPFPIIDNDTLQSLDALIGPDTTLHNRLGALLDAPAASPDNSQDEHQARILQALREHREGSTRAS